MLEHARKDLYALCPAETISLSTRRRGPGHVRREQIHPLPWKRKYHLSMKSSLAMCFPHLSASNYDQEAKHPTGGCSDNKIRARSLYHVPAANVLIFPAHPHTVKWGKATWGRSGHQTTDVLSLVTSLTALKPCTSPGDVGDLMFARR